MTITDLILLICAIGQIIVCFCVIRNYKKFCKNLTKPTLEKQAIIKSIRNEENK